MKAITLGLRLAVGLLFVLLFPLQLDAASTYVEPWEKIQDFIDMSRDGDVLIVRDGTFTGEGNRELHFDGKNITLTSEHGPETTIIDCEVQGRAFVLDMGVTQSALIEGLTIRNGSGDISMGAAFHLANGSSPTIENCVIENSLGTGIYADGSMYPCSPVIRDCEIRGQRDRNQGRIWRSTDHRLHDYRKPPGHESRRRHIRVIRQPHNLRVHHIRLLRILRQRHILRVGLRGHNGLPVSR